MHKPRDEGHGQDGRVPGVCPRLGGARVVCCFCKGRPHSLASNDDGDEKPLRVLALAGLTLTHHPHAPHRPLHLKTLPARLPRPRAWRGRYAPPALRTQAPCLPSHHPGIIIEGQLLYHRCSPSCPTPRTQPSNLCTTQCLQRSAWDAGHAGGLLVSRPPFKRVQSALRHPLLRSHALQTQRGNSCGISRPARLTSA